MMIYCFCFVQCIVKVLSIASRHLLSVNSNYTDVISERSVYRVLQVVIFAPLIASVRFDIVVVFDRFSSYCFSLVS